MPLVPDIEGFRAAQARLRDGLGIMATFLIPATSTTWAPGEPIDPDTGRPYDPFAEPVSGGGFTQVVKKVSFVTRPLASARSLRGERAETPIGGVDEAIAALIVDPDDYDDIKNATRVIANDTEWQIEQMRHDALSTAKRWIVYLEDA